MELGTFKSIYELCRNEEGVMSPTQIVVRRKIKISMHRALKQDSCTDFLIKGEALFNF